MPDKIITVEVDDKGFTVETEGFSGVGCDAIHDALEELGTSTGRTFKPEYHQNNNNQNTIHSGR